MAVYYLDSSALVKRYLNEIGSGWIRSLFDPTAGHTVFISAITGVEIVAAITRRSRGGTISAADAAAACSQFRIHLLTDYLVVAVSDALLNQAMTLAEGHGLRGYDAVQMAAALEVNARYLAGGFSPITLVSADTELNVAATVDGLMIEDPNAHP